MPLQRRSIFTPSPFKECTYRSVCQVHWWIFRSVTHAHLVQQITQEQIATEASNLVGIVLDVQKIPFDVQVGSQRSLSSLYGWEGEHECFTNISCFFQVSFRSTSLSAADNSQLAVCSICCERQKNAFLSCGHTYCMVCATQLQEMVASTCPICRGPIERVCPLFN